MVRIHYLPDCGIVDMIWLDRQREEDKHRKREEKDAARREKERHKRERVEERELREARERDKQAMYQTNQYQQGQYRAGAGRVSPYSAPVNLPGSVPSYQGAGQTAGRRPVSPYQSGGALPGQRPVSPYHAGGQLPGQVSPYHGGGQLPGQRTVSPYHSGGQLPGQRPVSPYQSGGALPGHRPVSPYHSGGALPSNKPVSPYHSGGVLPGTKPISPYHSGGVLPSTNRPVSPYHGGGNLPGTPSTYYSNPNYGSAYNEAERKMGDLAIGSKAAEYHNRKKSTGYQPAPGGDYPPRTPGGHYTTTTTGPSHSPYHQATTIQSQTNRDPYNRGPSPSPYSTPAYQPPPEEGILPPPEGFGRPPNAALSYTQFDTLKIQDMDDLVGNMPRMPAVLTTHDVYHEDWIRFMRDLSDAWLGRLPLPESAKQDGRPPKRSVMATDLVELWNDSFFAPRGVELVVYKGRERRNGRFAGQVDTHLPGFDLTADDITDSADDGEPDSEDDYVPPGGTRYGSHGGVYGRQDAHTLEEHQARVRRKEIRQEEKRKRKEREARRRMKELERKYTMYLTCSRPGALKA